MKIVARSIALAVVLSMLFSGPLATLAVAQPRTQPQPDLMQEAVKASAERAEADTTGYDVGAGFANMFYVPGKFIVCGLGVVVGGALLAATLGSGYKAAAAAGKEGCGGKWVLRGDDLRPTVPDTSERLVK